MVDLPEGVGTFRKETEDKLMLPNGVPIEAQFAHTLSLRNLFNRFCAADDGVQNISFIMHLGQTIPNDAGPAHQKVSLDTGYRVVAEIIF